MNDRNGHSAIPVGKRSVEAVAFWHERAVTVDEWREPSIDALADAFGESATVRAFRIQVTPSDDLRRFGAGDDLERLGFPEALIEHASVRAAFSLDSPDDETILASWQRLSVELDDRIALLLLNASQGVNLDDALTLSLDASEALIDTLGEDAPLWEAVDGDAYTLLGVDPKTGAVSLLAITLAVA